MVFAFSSIRDLLVKSKERVTLGADEDPPCQLAASPVASEDSLRRTQQSRRKHCEFNNPFRGLQVKNLPLKVLLK